MDGQQIVHLNEITFQRSRYYHEVATDINISLRTYRLLYGHANNESDLDLREIARRCARRTYQSGEDYLDEIETSSISKFGILFYHGLETDGGEIFWNLLNHDPDTVEDEEEKDELEIIIETGDYEKLEVGVFGTDDTKVIVMVFQSYGWKQSLGNLQQKSKHLKFSWLNKTIYQN